jgi:hypothetical protein
MIEINQLLHRTRASLNLIARRNMKRRHFVFKTVIAPIVVLVVFVPTLTVAVWKVLHGRARVLFKRIWVGDPFHVSPDLRFGSGS